MNGFVSITLALASVCFTQPPLEFSKWLILDPSSGFEFVAYGWPRCVSAVQSLLSIGLIALSIYSYFYTRPFDF